MFEESYISEIKQLYCILYPDYFQMIQDSDFNLPLSFHKMDYISLNEQRISTGQVILINHTVLVGSHPISFFSNPAHHAAEVLYFARHSILINETVVSHLFVIVNILQEHPNANVMGKPVRVWLKSVFDGEVVLSIHDIRSHLVQCDFILSDEKVLVTISNLEKII